MVAGLGPPAQLGFLDSSPFQSDVLLMGPIRDGLYRAAWVIPVSKPPIENGFFRVTNGVIAEIGRVPITGSLSVAVDLGDVAVLPGLVNSHTHLEFSDLDVPIGVQGNSLPDWVSAVVKHRQANVQLDDGRRSTIQKGLAELSTAGTALAADICTIGGILSDWLSEDLLSMPAVVCFLEILGLSPQRGEQCVDWADDMRLQWEQLNSSRSEKLELGLSPHATYSVPKQLLDRTVGMARNRGQTVAMHFAECEEEFELVERGCGPFRDSLESIGVYRENLFPISGGMDAVLQSLTQATRGLIIHGNYLTKSQIEMLAQHPHLSVVYCPRTHAFFGHPPHPIKALQKVGIRVVLGTDSRASNPDLSIWGEAQHLLQERSDFAPSALLTMITTEAADGLGRREYGRIERGLPARLIQVPLSRKLVNSEQLIDCIFEQSPKVII